jgi:L-fucose isomerase-like protein
VDLRELERRVEETQLAAEQARRQLLEAHRQGQVRQRAAMTPAAALKQ